MKVLLCFETDLLAEGIKKIILQLSGNVHFQLAQPGPQMQQGVLAADFDLLLIDIDSQLSDPVALLRSVKKKSPKKKVLFVCENLGRTVLQAYRNGLDGCFSKKESTAEIMTALGVVLDGKVHIPQSIIMSILCDGFVFTDFDVKLGQLTKREVVVLEHIASGKRMKEAARLLDLAPSTLSAHKQRIMKKLGLASSREFNNFLQAFIQQQKSLTGVGEALK